MRIAYLCNSFPEPTERYVEEEIRELRGRGVEIVPCGIRASRTGGGQDCRAQVTVFPLRTLLCVRATWLLMSRFARVRDVFARIFRGPEPASRRARALAHTWLGAYCAAQIRKSAIAHIHAHHGYFGSWVGMVAARLLGAGFSMTLHGSDLLVRKDYLDFKLKNCRVCFTISHFNRRHIRERYAEVEASQVVVQHLGVNPRFWKPLNSRGGQDKFHIVSVGRLHAVKNHSFLILACRALKSSGVEFRCTIAGEGEERPRLEPLIAQMGLGDDVRLAGHCSQVAVRELYANASVVVLTSHSEGIPLTLMEAMAMERIVVAPAITGIPELVIHGKTGLLYAADSMEDLLVQLKRVLRKEPWMEEVGKAARHHVVEEFNGPINVARFADRLLATLGAAVEAEVTTVARGTHEDSFLQQVQLRV